MINSLMIDDVVDDVTLRCFGLDPFDSLHLRRGHVGREDRVHQRRPA